MAESRPVIGFMGLGAIGGPMALRLADGGVDLVVYNRSGDRLKPFEGKARFARSPAELADMVDIAFSCLTDRQSYQDVILGPQGLIKGGRVKTYVHTGTNDLTIMGEVASGVQGRGVAVLDAPVTGGVAGAAAGKLTVMTAGPKAAHDLAAPLIGHYASKIVYLGEKVGSGQFAKLVNNVLSAANLAIASEAIVMGHKAGLDLVALLDVLNSGSGRNSATQDKIPKQVLTRAFKHGAGLGVMLKDVDAFLKEAAALGVPAPLGAVVREAYVKAIAEDGPQADVSEVIRAMERAAGVEMPKVL
jgi:3-hydroxyisobutyrate dehydrogenase-like beta-hydroxyacid dehydrogenase